MKKLLVVLFMVVSLPVVSSMVGSRPQAQAFNVVAEAGHSTVGGGYCDGPPCEHFPRTQSVTPAKDGKTSGPPDGGAQVVAGVMVALVALGFALRLMLK